MTHLCINISTRCLYSICISHGIFIPVQHISIPMLLIGTAGMLLNAAVLFAIGTILWQELPVNFSAQDQSASQTT